jgi:superfamily II DNA/RNA helicase
MELPEILTIKATESWSNLIKKLSTFKQSTSVKTMDIQSAISANFTMHHLTLDHADKRDHLMQIVRTLRSPKRKIIVLTENHLMADYLSCVLNLKLNMRSRSIHEFKSQAENLRAVEDFCRKTCEVLITNSMNVELKNSLAVTDIVNYDLLLPNPLYFERYENPNEILHVYQKALG